MPHKVNLKAKRKPATIVNFILDASSSMARQRTAVISGVNEYVETLRNDKKGRFLFTLIQFDTQARKIWDRLELKDIPKLTEALYNPAGMTALLDAVGQTIESSDEGLKGLTKADKPAVLTIIFTDGEENSSRKWSGNQIKEMIQGREAQGNWTFVYLGANQDAYLVGQQVLGVQTGNIVNYAAHASHQTLGLIGARTVAYSSLRDGGVMRTSNFFDATNVEPMHFAPEPSTTGSVSTS